jgi:hypothetical protein
MRLYAVSSGDYDEYHVSGIFDCPEKAERFRLYHNCDRVESHGELNPEIPESYDFMWEGVVNLEGEYANELRVHRISNDCIAKKWYYSGWGNVHHQVTCRGHAADLSCATRGMKMALEVFMEGDIPVTLTETENVGHIRKDGTPGVYATHRLEHTIQACWRGGEFVELSRETTREDLCYGCTEAKVWE